jgi:hypothetical protein
VRRPAQPGGNLLQGELPARSQHSTHFAVQPIAVGNVHRRILRPHDIEAVPLEGQVERITLPVIDLIDEPCQSREHLGNADKFSGQVDAADPAAVAPSKIPRRAAEPRPDIEHPLGSAKADKLGEPHRRRPLTAVELVDWCQVVRGQMVEVLAGRLLRGSPRRDRLGCSGSRRDFLAFPRPQPV